MQNCDKNHSQKKLLSLRLQSTNIITYDLSRDKKLALENAALKR